MVNKNMGLEGERGGKRKEKERRGIYVIFRLIQAQMLNCLVNFLAG